MVFDACACLKRRKTLKSRIQQSSQAVSRTNNATISTKKRKQVKTKCISKTRAFKNKFQGHFIASFKNKRGREGDLSSRIISWTQWNKQTKKKQTEQNINRVSYTNYSQPVKSASHHQRASQTSKSADIKSSQRPIRKGWQPSKSNKHHTEEKDGREGERTMERREI